MVKKEKFKVTLPQNDMDDLRFLMAKIRFTIEENPLEEIERLMQVRRTISARLRTASPVVKALVNYELAFRYEDLQQQAYEKFQGLRPADDVATYREKADCLLEAREAMLVLEGGPFPHLNVHILNYIGILEAMQDNNDMARMAFEAGIKALSRCEGETDAIQDVIQANLRTLNEQPGWPVYNR